MKYYYYYYYTTFNTNQLAEEGWLPRPSALCCKMCMCDLSNCNYGTFYYMTSFIFMKRYIVVIWSGVTFPRSLQRCFLCFYLFFRTEQCVRMCSIVKCVLYGWHFGIGSFSSRYWWVVIVGPNLRRYSAAMVLNVFKNLISFLFSILVIFMMTGLVVENFANFSAASFPGIPKWISSHPMNIDQCFMITQKVLNAWYYNSLGW